MLVFPAFKLSPTKKHAEVRIQLVASLVTKAKTGLQFPLLALHELGSADFSENLFLSVFKAACMLLKRQKSSSPELVKVTSLIANSDPTPKC